MLRKKVAVISVVWEVAVWAVVVISDELLLQSLKYPS
jgi:hypothetical protein